MSANRDSIEFYVGDEKIASAKSSMVPPVGSKISIRKKTYTVVRVTFALDRADEWSERGMRANVDLKLSA